MSALVLRPWRWLSGLVEWESGGRKVTIGGTTALAVTGAIGVLALSFFAGPGLIMLGGGLGGGSEEVPPSGPPNAPNILLVHPVTDSVSLRLELDAFSGSGSDTQDSTWIEVDSAGGDFSAPILSVKSGPVQRDTITSAAFVHGYAMDIRARYKGATGGWSNPSAVWSRTHSWTPYRILDPHVVSVTDSSATIGWTEVSDGLGQAANTDIRWDASPPIAFWEHSSLGPPTVDADSLTATGVGNARTYTIQGLPASTDFEVQLLAFRGVLNVNAVEGQASPVAAGRTAESGSPPAEPPGTHTFTVASDTYLEDIADWQDAGNGFQALQAQATGDYLLNTLTDFDGHWYAWNYSGVPTTNYYVQVDFEWNNTWNTVADVYLLLVARSQGSNLTGYQFFANINGDIGLEKSTSGSFSSLAESTHSFVVNTTYTARIEVSGSTLKAFIDGVQVLSATDSQITSGLPGLGTYVDQAGVLQLDNMEVAAIAATPTLGLLATSDTSAIQMLASGFDGTGQTHDSTEWRLDNNSNMGSPFYTLTSATDKTSHLAIDNANLTANAVVYGDVRFFGSVGGWTTRSPVASVVNVAPPPPGAGCFANEPAGFTPLTDRPFQAVTENGWWTGGTMSKFNIETGHTSAPSGDATVGRAIFPVGHTGGGGGNDGVPALGFTFGTEPADLYIALWHKVSANWQSHATGVNKVAFAVDNLQGGGDPFVLNAAFFSGSTYEYEGRKSSPSTGAVNYANNVSTVRVTKGSWALIEIVLRHQNSSGSSDGELHMWVNGTKTTQYTNIQWAASGSPQTWDHVKWEPVWGGAGDATTVEMYQYVDRWCVSGAN